MRGTVLDFSVRENKGFISSEDGLRFTFSGQDWRSDQDPNKGCSVDFVDGGEGKASDVFLVESPGRSRVKRGGMYRLSSDSVFGGVCAGLAEKANISKEAVRITAVVLTIIFFPTFFAYLIMWLVLPEAEQSES